LAQTTLTVPAAAVTVTATFKGQVTVDVTVTGGTINGGAGTGKFPEGTKLTIKASTPPAGQVFDRWTGAVSALANPAMDTTVLTVGNSAVVVASSFKAAPVAQVRVTLVAGVVVAPSTTGTYAAGSKIMVRANAAPAGRVFDRWTATAGVFANAAATETEYTVPSAAATVTATFKVFTASTAVLLSSHKVGDTVSVMGETVFGTVRTPSGVESLIATVSTNNRKAPLDIDPANGKFALRLFDGDVVAGQPVTIAFERKDKSGTTETAPFVLNGSAKAAKEYSQDRATSDNGGFFTDPATSSNRLSLRTLEDPVLYFTIDTMKVGDITKPIRFEDPREGTKVRILFFKAKYPAHRANLEDDYEKMKAATLRRKEEDLLSKWFVIAKEDVFIDIDPAYDRCNPLQEK
jgi:hypothetical protein